MGKSKFQNPKKLKKKIRGRPTNFLVPFAHKNKEQLLEQLLARYSCTPEVNRLETLTQAAGWLLEGNRAK